jgi:RimJ/RimL family protein N-acetyltransferase
MLKLFERFRKRDNTIAEGKKVNLRPLYRRDFRIISKWFRDNELMSYAFGITVEKDVIEKIALDYYNDLYSGTSTAYGIETKGGLLIGFIRYSVRQDSDNYARIGILIGDRNYWEQGIGTEALKLSLADLFERRHLTRIELDTAMFNLRAQRCFEKCGFKRMGELTDVNFLTGEMSHKVWMKITREEFSSPGEQAP